MSSLKDKRNKEISDDEKIKQFLKAPNVEDVNNKSSSSTEEAILNKIRK